MKSRVTVRGMTFEVEIEDERVVTLIDPVRGGAKVIAAVLPAEAAKYSSERDKFQRKLGRLVLESYEAQIKMAYLKAQTLPGIELSQLERQKGVGVVKPYDLGAGSLRGMARRWTERNSDDE